jgi:hypothetical protein
MGDVGAAERWMETAEREKGGVLVGFWGREKLPRKWRKAQDTGG